MILTCPECQTRYQTDAAVFRAEGRKVRCAKCGHVWHQGVPPPAVQPESDPAIAPAAESEHIASPSFASQQAAYAPAAATPVYAPRIDAPPRRSGPPEYLGIAAGWLGLAALIIVIAWSAMRFREEIAIVWPQTASLYAAIGNPVNTRGLKIEDVNYRSETADGQSVLAVTGRLTNVTSHELVVPPIRITLTDNDRRVLYDWSFTASVATLRPGQAVNFLTRLSSPPSAARHLQVHFAENKE